MNMDDFLEKRGRWHWAVLALNAYAAVPHAWFVMAPSFMAPTKQNYTCFMTNSSNLSYSEAAAIESGLDNRCYLNVTGVVEKCTDWQFDTHEFKRTLQMDVSNVYLYIISSELLLFMSIENERCQQGGRLSIGIMKLLTEKMMFLINVHND